MGPVQSHSIPFWVLASCLLILCLDGGLSDIRSSYKGFERSGCMQGDGLFPRLKQFMSSCKYTHVIFVIYMRPLLLATIFGNQTDGQL